MSPSPSLKSIPLFSGLPEKELSALEKVSTSRHYKRNVIVVSQGDEANSFYLIISGSVRVYISDEDGREVTLNTLSAGDAFGELALLSDQPRSASVATLEESHLLTIAKVDFLDCMERFPQITRGIIKALIERVQALTDEVSSLALLDVYGRVRRLLIKNAEDRNGALVVPRMTHSAIATCVGSSREMVSKIFSDLSRGHYISVEKEWIRIEKELPAGW
jgi:CRP/FNR family cyclic AMP-dependent transcriptional regulator